MWCQLKALGLAGDRPSMREEVHSGAGRQIRYVRLTAHKLWKDPMLIVRKLRRVLGLTRPGGSATVKAAGQCRLGLEAGDWVRVKSQADIRATLDDFGACQGLAYMDGCMDRFCGGTYKVLRRVDRFYDERAERMLKVKNTVLLDGVYCEPGPDAVAAFAGCQRMCFLFWKEPWLERADRPPNVDR